MLMIVRGDRFGFLMMQLIELVFLMRFLFNEDFFFFGCTEVNRRLTRLEL